MRIERFEDIDGWKLGRELAAQVYKLCRNEGFNKDWGLKDQIQRAAGSVMHNIAEGFDGGSNAEFIKFLKYSQRSASEVRSQLYLALDQQYITQAEFDQTYDLAGQSKDKIGRFIAYLLKSEADKPRTRNQEPGTKS